MNTIFAATVTREILWNVPPWARVLMYVLFLAAAAVTLKTLLLKDRQNLLFKINPAFG